MAEHGISTDDADYESLTEEQKNLEHQFFTEMWNEYYERYPEANEGDNRYNSVSYTHLDVYKRQEYHNPGFRTAHTGGYESI